MLAQTHENTRKPETESAALDRCPTGTRSAPVLVVFILCITFIYLAQHSGLWDIRPKNWDVNAIEHPEQPRLKHGSVLVRLTLC